MISVDTIAEKVEEQLAALQLSRGRRINDNFDIVQNTHDCLFNWIIDKTTSARSIFSLLNILVKLKGFHELDWFKELVAVTCLEGIAGRKPEVLQDSWEELLFKIVIQFIYISYETTVECNSRGIISFNSIKQWLLEYCSPKLCPNPCLRVELFGFMLDLKVEDNGACKDYFIITLFDLNDKLSRIYEEDVEQFSPGILERLIRRYSLDIGNLMKLEYTKAKKERMVEAVLKVTKWLVAFEIDRENKYLTQGPSKDFGRQMVDSSLHFYGLLPDLQNHSDIKSFAEVVSSNILLQQYVADTLNPVARNFYKIHSDDMEKGIKKIDCIINALESAEARLQSQYFPLSLRTREMKGTTPQIVYQMTYFTDINHKDSIIGQKNRDHLWGISDYTSENSFDINYSNSSEFTDSSEFSGYDAFSESSYDSD